mmetsp:Transcript_24488/g.40271  ORF Transcript_24488/g.40271 Transcript_24488/m.40271 type:complete len:340 (+) Transcript_24488:155-1174(+)
MAGFRHPFDFPAMQGGPTFGFGRSIIDDFFNVSSGDIFMEHFFGRDMQPRLETERRSRTGPIIEELPDEDSSNSPITNQRSRPRVQEPDDTPAAEDTRRPTSRSSAREREVSGFSVPMRSTRGASSDGGNSYSFFSSSSIKSVNGVTESTSTACDSTGRERVIIQRKLGDKGRTVVRERDATGVEKKTDTLQNLRSDEASVFDSEWRRAAERNLSSMPSLLGSARHSTPPSTAAALEYSPYDSAQSQLDRSNVRPSLNSRSSSTTGSARSYTSQQQQHQQQQSHQQTRQVSSGNARSPAHVRSTPTCQPRYSTGTPYSTRAGGAPQSRVPTNISAHASR